MTINGHKSLNMNRSSSQGQIESIESIEKSLSKTSYGGDGYVLNIERPNCPLLIYKNTTTTDNLSYQLERSGNTKTLPDDKTIQFVLPETKCRNLDKLSPHLLETGHIDDLLKSNFYKSVDTSNNTECQSLLKSNTLSNILPLLATGLAKAFDSGNHRTVNIIHSYIAENSAPILIEFRKKYTETLNDSTVWIGTECSCNKIDEKKYEDQMCEKPKPVFIVETNSELITINVGETFHGFLIKEVTDDTPRKNESSKIEQSIKPETQQRLDRVPQSVAKSLFKKHSNLTMVCPSAYKSKGFGTEDFVIYKVNCINLFCRIKGIIPIGEHHLPLKINGVLTNVLEGTSYFTSAVHIGDKIYNSKEGTGTLGGFVKYYGIDTFLTCAHVIFGKSNISNLQTKDIHFNCHTMTTAIKQNQ